jgi:hypothetical protein
MGITISNGQKGGKLQKNIQNGNIIYQYLPFQGRPKNTKIGIYDMWTLWKPCPRDEISALG